MGARGVWESTVYDPEQGVSVKDSRLGCVSVFAINTLLSIDSNMFGERSHCTANASGFDRALERCY
jgi:hypothetical protein